MDLQSWSTQTKRNGAQNRVEPCDTASRDIGRPPGENQLGSGGTEMPGYTYALETDIYAKALGLIGA